MHLKPLGWGCLMRAVRKRCTRLGVVRHPYPYSAPLWMDTERCLSEAMPTHWI